MVYNAAHHPIDAWGGPGLELKRAVVSTVSTDTTLVAAVAGKKIRVVSILLVCDSSVGVRFESDTAGTALTGVMTFAANGGLALPFNSNGWIETVAGELLNMELSGAVQVSGSITYVEV